MSLLILALSASFAQEPAAEAADPFLAELTTWLQAAGAPADEVPVIAAQMVGFERSLPWQTGAVSLRDGAVALQLADGDRYVGPEAASQVLEAWGNPADPDTDGMVLPAGSHLFGPGSWAVLVRYAADGWVDDAEASSIDYDELLKAKQEGQVAGNEERKKLGLDAVTIGGWAESPHYDAASHVLYWATLLHAEGGGSTLNYDVRVLGRRGVLSLNALADQQDLPRIKSGMERIRAVATFTEGNRYADYVEGVDTKAAYGIAALVAGGAIAAKTGVLKGLLVLLLASKKFVFIGIVAAAGAVRALWGRMTAKKE